MIYKNISTKKSRGITYTAKLEAGEIIHTWKGTPDERKCPHCDKIITTKHGGFLKHLLYCTS
jgi:hypothetical protein